MGHSTCCVVGCENTGRNSNYKFYRFPTAAHALEQRKKWINAVKRKNVDGTLWIPKSSDRICSQHFVNNAKSANQYSPSYVPTLFPSAYMERKVDAHAAASRHTRFMNRRQGKKILADEANKLLKKTRIERDENDATNEPGNHHRDQENFYIEQECQVNFISNCTEPSRTFICNRYIYKSNSCDAQTQTDIIENTDLITILNQEKSSDIICGTSKETFVDHSVGPDSSDEKNYSEKIYFPWYSFIRSDHQLLDLAGVTRHNFKFLLNRMPECEKWNVTKENSLLILLFKLKTGLTFSAMSALFSVPRTKISKIFFYTLQHLVCATKNLVFWPSKDVVRETMPECFKKKYINTRVIIDCTEFRIEAPAGIDNRALTYSNCKKGFTAKLLIGVSPGGFISFKSKVAGGRKSDSQMTIESGLLDLLEDGDVVLANKGFSGVKTSIDDCGKKVILVVPPFLQNKSEFTEKEAEEAYGIASVGIHVERIMQRLRIYQILNKIPENLFYHIDDIVHLCCVLVNLQPPYISEQDKSAGNH